MQATLSIVDLQYTKVGFHLGHTASLNRCSRLYTSTPLRNWGNKIEEIQFLEGINTVRKASIFEWCVREVK